jgi:starvation-inducible DNA-binding protein
MPRTTFYGRKHVQVTIQPNIGLDASTCQSVVEMLNLLLADEAVLSLKTRSADGHSDGAEADRLKSLLDAQAQQIQAISAEIVERIQILGGVHLSDANELIDSARLRGEILPVPGVVNILADHEAFIRFLREDVRECSENYEDQGSFMLLVHVLRIHEKIAWILRSHIASGQFTDET